MNHAHVVREAAPKIDENPMSKETMMTIKAWKQSDFLCRDYLTGLMILCSLKKNCFHKTNNKKMIKLFFMKQVHGLSYKAVSGIGGGFLGGAPARCSKSDGRMIYGVSEAITGMVLRRLEKSRVV
ncbi:unnamed protein product [Prunus brigantina]